MGVCSREVFLALGLVPCLLALLRIIDNELRASVLLSIGVATFGFYATKSIIPVLKPYTVRSNLFGYDINKKGVPQQTSSVLASPYHERVLLSHRHRCQLSAQRNRRTQASTTCKVQGLALVSGTEAGEKKIPESLGLAPGVVFLVCIILTEQLHAFGISQWLRPGEDTVAWTSFLQAAWVHNAF